jgi:HPP family
MGIDFSLVSTYGQEFGIVLGPFGALMGLLFSLTSAPASQPRNILFGQTLSLFIAYGFGRTSMDGRMKACLSTSIAIALMARLGITHPPAGASALIFSSGSHSLSQIGIMLMANAVAIFLGAWCNNISDKRQYPTSWHIVPFFDVFSGDSTVTRSSARNNSTRLRQEDRGSNVGSSSRKSEGTIDLKVVLAQARDPAFLIHDHDKSVTDRSKVIVEMQNGSPASHLVVDDESQSKGTIELSEVIAAARNPGKSMFVSTMTEPIHLSDD